MLELVGSGLISVWLDMAGVKVKPFDAFDILGWQNSPGLVIAPDPNPAVANVVQQYFQEVEKSKLVAANELNNQGIWIQSGPIVMANHQGTVPMPAASLTKTATTLVALNKLGPDHQFETSVSATGPIVNGVLQGDLVINGGGDPFFVWQEAITLGNTLNQMGIKSVAGNLVVNDQFAVNFQRNPVLAGQLLKQSINSATWPRNAAYEYSIMPKGTPKPQVIIAGKVIQATQPIPRQTLLLRHRSLPLKKLIREMNIYSNNDMAEMLAQAVGGYTVVQSTAAKLANVPQDEITLINGSGLGPENRISPRAICAILMAVQREAASHQLSLADLFLTSGYDRRGTIYGRHLPYATVIKTGTLNNVSTLAGVVPTSDRGLVWFTILNHGPNISGFHAEQDKLVQNIVKELQVASVIPTVVTPQPGAGDFPQMGLSTSDEIVYRP